MRFAPFLCDAKERPPPDTVSANIQPDSASPGRQPFDSCHKDLQYEAATRFTAIIRWDHSRL